MMSLEGFLEIDIHVGARSSRPGRENPTPTENIKWNLVSYN